MPGTRRDVDARISRGIPGELAAEAKMTSCVAVSSTPRPWLIGVAADATTDDPAQIDVHVEHVQPVVGTRRCL
jgi:hypothetical protein